MMTLIIVVYDRQFRFILLNKGEKMSLFFIVDSLAGTHRDIHALRQLTSHKTKVICREEFEKLTGLDAGVNVRGNVENSLWDTEEYLYAIKHLDADPEVLCKLLVFPKLEAYRHGEYHGRNPAVLIVH
jgi:hypothetical protein